MKKNILSISLLFLFTAVTIVYLYQSISFKPPKVEQEAPSQPVVVEPTPGISVTNMTKLDVSKWQVFKSDVLRARTIFNGEKEPFRFQFRHPSDWSVTQEINTDHYADCGTFQVTSPNNGLLKIEIECVPWHGEQTPISGNVEFIKTRTIHGNETYLQHIVRVRYNAIYRYMNISTYPDEDLPITSTTADIGLSYGPFRLLIVISNLNENVPPQDSELTILDNIVDSITLVE